MYFTQETSVSTKFRTTMNAKTIPEMFIKITDEYSGQERPIYLQKIKGSYTGVSYSELRTNVECFAMGLSELGVDPGDRIGIVSENRLEWVMSDMAVAALGAVDVPVFPTLTPFQLQYVFNNCQASIVVVSNGFQLSKMLKIREELESLEYIIVMQEDARLPDDKVLSMSDVIERGRRKYDDAERTKRFKEKAHEVREDDLLTIIYTSGTTGNPKGVMLTHKNLISNVIAANEVVKLSDKDVFLSYLPMCHAYERIGGYYIAFAYGSTTAFAESIDTVRTNLQEIRPTIMTSVPRLFERIKNAVVAKVEKDSPTKQKIFNWALGVGKKYVEGQLKGSIGLLTRTQYALADKLVFSKIRALTGGRLRYFVSGGGALPSDVNQFFRMLGMVILEGYGLTETSPVLTITRPDNNEIGTVGTPLFNVEIKIANDGEILARGPNIMRGYWKEPQATAETIDEQGWLHTGDIGFVNERGNLKITDRKKNIFVSSGGKNIAPVPIENAILQSKFVDQIMLIGEKREFCTALIVPDYDLLRSLANTAGIQPSESIDSIVNDDRIIREVKREIDLHQRDLAKYERVRKIVLLSQPFNEENGMMTPTLKIKRKVVEEKYKDIIEKMYVGTENEY